MIFTVEQDLVDRAPTEWTGGELNRADIAKAGVLARIHRGVGFEVVAECASVLRHLFASHQLHLDMSGQHDLLLTGQPAVSVERLEKTILWRMLEPVEAKVELAMLKGHEAGRGEKVALASPEDLLERFQWLAIKREDDFMDIKVNKCSNNVSGLPLFTINTFRLSIEPTQRVVVYQIRDDI